MDQPFVEDQTQDSEIASNLKVVEPPKSEFVRPAYSFKGVELWPYSYCYRSLFWQVSDRQDTGLWSWQAFAFMLLKRSKNETAKEHRDWMKSLAWNVDKFRDELLDWLDANPLSQSDLLELSKIYQDNMKADADSQIEAIPVRGKAQKKTSHQKKQ